MPNGMSPDPDDWTEWQLSEWTSYEQIRQIEEAGSETP